MNKIYPLHGFSNEPFVFLHIFLQICGTTATSRFEDNKIITDYKCTGRVVPFSRNQMMVICGEIVSMQNVQLYCPTKG